MKTKIIDINKVIYLYDTTMFTEEEIYSKGFREAKYLNSPPKNFPYYIEAVLHEDIICITYLPKIDKDVTIDEIRSYTKSAITSYDKSKEVNVFYIGDREMWLDKNDRVALLNLIYFKEKEEVTVIDLWLPSTPPIKYTISIIQAKEMLKSLEDYAKLSYDTTQNHIVNIYSLDTLEAIKTYDYKIGYPEKLHFILQ